MVFMERPAALLRVVPVSGEVAEDHLQPLFIVTHLTLRQRCTHILQGQKTSRRVYFFHFERPSQLMEKWKYSLEQI